MEHVNLLFSRIKEYEKILFARNLGAMLSAGLSLARALSVMQRQTKNLKLARTIGELENSVKRGDPLHKALEQFPTIFPHLFVAMVRAGEEGGDLPASLLVVADQTERIYDLKRKVRSAMIYPCIIVFAIVVIGILMMIYVVPTLASTFAESNATLPLSTRFVIGLSGFLVHYTLFALFGMIGFVTLVYSAVRTARGKRIADYTFLHVPVIGTLIREVNAARTARTLSSLLSSGVDVLTSLEICEDVVQNTYFKEVISAAAKSVRGGEALSVQFARREDLYPPFVGEMMSA